MLKSKHPLSSWLPPQPLTRGDWFVFILLGIVALALLALFVYGVGVWIANGGLAVALAGAVVGVLIGAFIGFLNYGGYGTAMAWGAGIGAALGGFFGAFT